MLALKQILTFPTNVSKYGPRSLFITLLKTIEAISSSISSTESIHGLCCVKEVLHLEELIHYKFLLCNKKLVTGIFCFSSSTQSKTILLYIIRFIMQLYCKTILPSYTSRLRNREN